MGLQCPPLLLKELMRLQTLVDSGNHNFSRWLKGAKNSSNRMYSVVLLLKVWSYAIETCWWTNWFKGAHLFAYTHKNTRSHLRSPNKSYWNVSPVTISAITRFASHDKWSHFVCPCVCTAIYFQVFVCVTAPCLANRIQISTLTQLVKEPVQNYSRRRTARETTVSPLNMSRNLGSKSLINE